MIRIDSVISEFRLHSTPTIQLFIIILKAFQQKNINMKFEILYLKVWKDSFQVETFPTLKLRYFETALER